MQRENRWASIHMPAYRHGIGEVNNIRFQFCGDSGKFCVVPEISTYRGIAEIGRVQMQASIAYRLYTPEALLLP
jgi:hypothetical protein